MTTSWKVNSKKIKKILNSSCTEIQLFAKKQDVGYTVRKDILFHYAPHPKN